MIISTEELERLHRKYPYPRFSPAEYERRYQNIRTLMKKKDLDCLLIIGGSAAYGRVWFNVRYVTNMIGKAELCYYCLFPREGDPCLVIRPGHALAEGMLARTVVRELVVGDTLEAMVAKIKDLGAAQGRIGIVEYEPAISIPKNHWDYLTANLPQAEFVFVTREFLALRHIKSAEEVLALEKSAEFGDLAMQALAQKLRPGMTEAQAFAIVYEAAVSNGGEVGMIQLASVSMLAPGLNDQHPRPVERIIGDRDLINSELGIFYNGYEAQTGKPIVTGPPTAVIKDLFAVALEGYGKMAETLYPGKSSVDSLQVGKWIQDSAFDFYGSFLQGMGGKQPRQEPLIDMAGVSSPFGDGGDLIYKEGMNFTLQMHIVTKDKSAGIFLADTFVVTADGHRCLNKFPPQLIEV